VSLIVFYYYRKCTVSVRVEERKRRKSTIWSSTEGAMRWLTFLGETANNVARACGVLQYEISSRITQGYAKLLGLLLPKRRRRYGSVVSPTIGCKNMPPKSPKVFRGRWTCNTRSVRLNNPVAEQRLPTVFQHPLPSKDKN
jgi:hypothetical protein